MPTGFSGLPTALQCVSYGPMSHTSKAQKAFLKHDHIGDRKNKMDYFKKLDETVKLYLTLTAVQTS